MFKYRKIQLGEVCFGFPANNVRAGLQQLSISAALEEK